MFAARPFLRTAEAAKYVGLAKSTLEKRRCYGNSPPCFKLSNIVYYSIVELDAWLASERRFTQENLRSNFCENNMLLAA